jgi:hypothetical protein
MHSSLDEHLYEINYTFETQKKFTIKIKHNFE